MDRSCPLSVTLSGQPADRIHRANHVQKLGTRPVFKKQFDKIYNWKVLNIPRAADSDNMNFVNRAPAHVVEAERGRKKDLLEQHEKLGQLIGMLSESGA